jgi:hypothetical protein
VLPTDGDGKIIRFRLRDAGATRKAALRSRDTTGESKVVRFRPRGIASGRGSGLGSSDAMYDSPVVDLRRYESAPAGDDDYRHRMLTNFLATIVLVVLMVAGDWTLSALVTMTREGQDCCRPGASNCGAIYMPGHRG